MKIGLIGINRYAKFLNFAYDLHIYAFQQYLAQLGHESVILDYKPVTFGAFDMRHPADYAESKYRDAVMKKSKKDIELWSQLALGYRTAARERERRFDMFEAFIDKNLVFTPEKYDSDALEVEDPGFDCYICVTDVIWQSVPTHLFDRGFLLGSKAFEGKGKIAYAASRGFSPPFTEQQSSAFFDYLRDFDAISVRENDFREYIEENSELEAPTVLDPVLLHDADFWADVAQPPKEERYVLLYYVMEKSADTIAKAVEYAKAHDLTLVELSDRPLKYGKVDDPDVKHIARYDVSMEEWLGYIQHADAVFTNSFHGCCFSLLFEKTFFVGSRNGQKVPNFLATFGLQGRQFSRDVNVSDLDPHVSYEGVREILAQRRSQSTDFLVQALETARTGAATRPPLSLLEDRRRHLTYPAIFHSGYGGEAAELRSDRATRALAVSTFGDGSFEYQRSGDRYENSGSDRIKLDSRFVSRTHTFAGWTLRVRIDNHWYWYLDDGTLARGDVRGDALDGRKAVLGEKAAVPHLPVSKVSVVVFVARWKPRVLHEATGSARRAARAVARRVKRSLRRSR